MSIEAMSWALNEAPVTDASALLVLLGLANHAHRDGSGAYPSRETLAHYARCSVRTVSIKLRVLEDAGIIKRGNQTIVSHFPTNRRPVVYDLDYSVEPAKPAGSGYEKENLGVKILHPSDSDVQTYSPQEDSGVKLTVVRGEDGGSSDVQAPAHKPSLQPSIEPSAGVLTKVSTEGEPAEKPDVPKRIGWWPSDQAIATARSLNPLTDIPISVTKYKVVMAERKQRCESSTWLKWFLQDEKDAIAKQRELEASRSRNRKWYDVAE